jgi:hypothetical protein
VTLVAVSAPPQLWPVYVGCAAVLAAVARAGRVSLGELWRRARIVLFPVLLVAATVPLVREGGGAYGLGPLTVHGDGLVIAAGVAAKAVLGTVAAAPRRFPPCCRASPRCASRGCWC